MLELIALLTVGALVVGVLALVGLFFKIVFKIVLLPVWIVLGLLKLALGLVAGIAGLVLAILAIAFIPLAIVLFLVVLAVGLPLLALASVVGLGWAVVT